MARSATVEIENNFTKGLITEATGLNFPPNACVDTDNCKFDFKGVVTRRFGLDYEASYSSFTSVRNSSAISTYVWTSVGGNGDITFVVVQIGATIYFYLEDEDGPLSPGKQTFTLTLSGIAGNPGEGTQPCQFTQGKGYLFITHPYCKPQYVKYVPATPTMTATNITVRIRDLDGLAPTSTYQTSSVVDYTKRPTSTRAALDDFDEYNLQNAGWNRTITNNAGASVVALTEWDNDNTTMPSLGDVWHSWQRDTTVDFDYRSAAVDGHPSPNSRGPMGYYLLEAFSQERDGPSGIAGLSNDDVNSSYFRPKTCAFYAGRVWYTGVDYEKFNNNLYFTKVIENEDDFERCYQVNDPTSEETADLLASDGGVVRILDCGTIYKIAVMGSMLIIWANNGIWGISGSADGGGGFAANDYTVRKLSSVGAISGRSFVDVEGTWAWWNLEGIWMMVPNDSGSLEAKNLSKQSIQTKFEDIPSLNIKYVQGAYNRSERIIQWVYRQATSATTENNYNYDSVMNMNVQTGAFYTWSIDTTVGVTINSIIVSKGSTTTTEEVLVTDSAVQVTDGGENVSAFVSTTAIIANSFRFLTTKNSGGTNYDTTWSGERDELFVDWETPGTGVSYSSYVVTGYVIGGQAQRDFQADYVWLYFETQGGASCFFQSLWDYSSISSKRTSTAWQAYRSRTARDVQVSRILVRGSGKARQFKLYSEAGKPFRLIGWSIWNTQTSTP